MDATAMSLDDIIKTKKKSTAGLAKKKAGGAGGKGANKPVAGGVALKVKSKRLAGTLPAGPKVIVDARNKIIQRNRSKITDARDKLAQITKQSGDVRLKLIRKMQLSRKGHSSVAGEAFLPSGVAGRLLKKRPVPYMNHQHLVALFKVRTS